MKTRSFTSILTLALALGFSQFSAQAQLSTGTGTGWDGLQPSSSLLIDENFQGYEFFHTDENTDEGNSDNSIDETTFEFISGYKCDTTEYTLLESDQAVTFIFDSCAFAPEWYTAWGYRDALSADDLDNILLYQTENVSKGFVEVSRDAPYGVGSFRGYFIVDLRDLEYVEAIQYSHSSTGGNKRGIQVDFSLDDGATWDTLRYQPGNTWSESFTKDIYTGVKTSNGYRCDPSAYGMLWEDAIYESGIMLRFLECGGQTIRLHDFKVYGDLKDPKSAVKDVKENTIKVYSHNGIARLSEEANVNVYNLSGVQVKSLQNTSSVSLKEFPRGLYIFKMETRGVTETTKVIN